MLPTGDGERVSPCLAICYGCRSELYCLTRYQFNDDRCWADRRFCGGPCTVACYLMGSFEYASDKSEGFAARRLRYISITTETSAMPSKKSAKAEILAHYVMRETARQAFAFQPRAFSREVQSHISQGRVASLSTSLLALPPLVRTAFSPSR